MVQIQGNKVYMARTIDQGLSLNADLYIMELLINITSSYNDNLIITIYVMIVTI